MEATEKRIQELERTVRDMTKCLAGVVQMLESLNETSRDTHEAIRILSGMGPSPKETTLKAVPTQDSSHVY